MSAGRALWRLAKRAGVGHDSGLTATVRTRRSLRMLRRAGPPVQAGAGARAGARRLHRSGSLRADTSVSADLVAYLQAGLALADDPGASVAMGGRIKEAVRYVVDPLGRLPRIRELLTPELAELVKAWYGTEFRIASVRMWRIAHIPDEEWAFHQYGNLWHMDGHPVDVMKMFIQISDCPPAAGSGGAAFRYLGRSHTRVALFLGYVNQSHIGTRARRFIEERAIRFEEPPGTVLFVDTDRCLHRAGNPAPGTTRGMLQLYLVPSAAAPSGGDYFAEVPADPNVREGAVA